MKRLSIVFFLMVVLNSWAQQDFAFFEQALDDLAIEQPGLNERMVSEVSGLNLAALITSIGVQHKVTVSVDPVLDHAIEANYYNIPVKDIFVFLAKRYDLDTNIINKVVVFKKKLPPVVKPKKWKPRKVDVKYRDDNGFLSVNFRNDSLPRIAEAITKVSKRNIVVAPNLNGKMVSGYFQNRPFDDIMNMVGQSNGLLITKNENGSYFIEADAAPKDGSNSQESSYGARRPRKAKGQKGYYDVVLTPSGFLKVKSFEATATDIIMEAAELLGLHYYFYTTPSDVMATISHGEITFDELLDAIFRGQDYTYTHDDKGFYFVGKRDQEGLRATELIQLENRTIEKVVESIPAELKKGLEVKAFPELNGFIVSGSKPRINELRLYVYQIDKVVPMVQLEVFIVQYNKSHDVQVGMKAGIDDKARATSGVLFPTADVNLNAQSVNGLIDLFNGFGVFNLGKVTKQFYANLKFLENNSVLKVGSTPKIATLSGHEAKLKIGETSYYFVQQNNFVPLGNNNTVAQSGKWENTEANLSVVIKPYVSKDEQITLKLTVEKSSFLARAGENAPPGKATQSFESELRIKSDEMGFLGGLDELKNENSGTGVPVISRIPVLKWFFSGRAKKKSKSKLHLFVKPTVTY